MSGTIFRKIYSGISMFSNRYIFMQFWRNLVIELAHLQIDIISRGTRHPSCTVLEIFIIWIKLHYTIRNGKNMWRPMKNPSKYGNINRTEVEIKDVQWKVEIDAMSKQAVTHEPRNEEEKEEYRFLYTTQTSLNRATPIYLEKIRLAGVREFMLRVCHLDLHLILCANVLLRGTATIDDTLLILSFLYFSVLIVRKNVL